ncbi:MAG: hypothetical protein LM583_04990 [Desulfurococcaceae archaeon]|nr:hypothetical protein [Desulfurococcaceae archaeon]
MIISSVKTPVRAARKLDFENNTAMNMLIRAIIEKIPRCPKIRISTTEERNTRYGSTYVKSPMSALENIVILCPADLYKINNAGIDSTTTIVAETNRLLLR